MPTTFSQIIFFALLALPGIPYLAVRRRQRSDLERSPFRETVNVVTVGLVADIAMVFPAWLAATIWPAVALDVSALIKDTPTYLADHYTRAGLWLFTVLIAAAAAAWGMGHLVNRKMPTHPAHMSSWEVLFNLWRQGQPTLVGCELDDGSWIQGKFGSSNTDAKDLPDRDIILVQPLHAMEAGQTELRSIDGSALCVSARNIRTMTVTYLAEDAAPQATIGVVPSRPSSGSASDEASTPTPPGRRPPDAAPVPL